MAGQMENAALQQLEALNHIKLTEEERALFLKNYGEYRAQEALLAACDTSNTKPAVYVTELKNLWREDLPVQSFTRDALLSGAPEQTDGYFQVPRLVD